MEIDRVESVLETMVLCLLQMSAVDAVMVCFWEKARSRGWVGRLGIQCPESEGRGWRR